MTAVEGWRRLFALVPLLGLLVAAGAPLAGTDSDGDGFDDAQEAYFGTLSYAWCPVAHGPGTVPVRVNPLTLAGWNQGSWPPDLTNDGIVNVADLLVYNPTLATGRGFSYMPDGSLLAPERRLDLNHDSVVNLGDWLTIAKYLGERCE